MLLSLLKLSWHANSLKPVLSKARRNEMTEVRGKSITPYSCVFANSNKFFC